MHVLFVSACEKRAAKRTRAVLDSYALRTGEKTWASPMTLEGLREIRSALRSGATRQTAVACYRNEGRQRMKLLWVVGSRKAFGPDGHFPAGSCRAKTVEAVPAWVRVASLLARAAGLCHDLGKASLLFQDKLEQAGPVQDCVRHEWISMRLVQAMRSGRTWDEAWAQVGVNEKWLRDAPFPDGIRTAWDALDYLVVSHHRLPGPAGNANLPDESNHFSGSPLDKARLKPKADFPAAEVFGAVERLLERAGRLAAGADHRYWRAVAGIARAGLILADHEVSAEDHVPKGRPAPVHALYANTNQGRQLNQCLLGHLRNVAGAAADKAYRLATLKLPGLSEEAVESLGQAASHPDFQWQNVAAGALEALRGRSGQPVLLFNMAGTGAGKTRMNARAACILSGGPVRFAVALNLRTLTLQTGDALRGQLGIGADEMACVVGDAVARRLHEAGMEAGEDVDGNPPEAEFEASSEEFALPAWLDPLAKAKPVLRAVIGAPVLVSTIDYLIAAGMPHAQGHHAGALLRLADSDLVLDEVDGYDPKPLVAVLRLVQAAALFGRNVICSTATLAGPVAAAVFEAYRSGADLRGAMLGGEAHFACGLIDNYARPEIADAAGSAGFDFKAFYRRQIDRARPRFADRLRVPYLQAVEGTGPEAWRQAVLAGVLRLHEAHAWPHGPSGKRISIGLVRVANIGPAIQTARFLAAALPHARVACYHSQDFAIRRFLKEREMDRLLTRKTSRQDPSGNGRILADAGLSMLLRQAEAESVPFIVVATPVEEIGRDHDFDWAVIEPSSIRSIVQTAGRVNRHRKRPADSPNIALLQHNLKAAAGARVAFARPGFESADDPYPSHDLGALLKPGLRSIDAGLMFDGHPFAGHDDASLEKTLERAGRRLFLAEEDKPWWASQGIYEEYLLREGRGGRYRFMLDDEEGFKLWQQERGKPAGWVERNGSVKQVPKTPNAWLAWDPEDLFGHCKEFGLAMEQGMRFDMGKDSAVFDLSFGAE